MLATMASLATMATMACLLIANFAQAQAGVGAALRESVMVDEKNPARKSTDKDLDDMENTDYETREQGKGAKASKDTSKLTLVEGTAGTKRKGVTVKKKGNKETRKVEIPTRDDADAKLWERLAKEKSKDDQGQGEFKEEEIDANLWDKLVLEQSGGKRNKSEIVDEAIARAANETKREEEDEKLEQDVSLLTETDWSEAINFLQMEQFSGRQGLAFTFSNFIHP